MIARASIASDPRCGTHQQPAAYCIVCVNDFIRETKNLEEAKASTRNYLSGQIGLCIGFVAGFLLAILAIAWP